MRSDSYESGETSRNADPIYNRTADDIRRTCTVFAPPEPPFFRALSTEGLEPVLQQQPQPQPHARNPPPSGAKVKCKRVKAARKPSDAPAAEAVTTVGESSAPPSTGRRFAHVFKFKPKTSIATDQSPARDSREARARSLSAAALFGRQPPQSDGAAVILRRYVAPPGYGPHDVPVLRLYAATTNSAQDAARLQQQPYQQQLLQHQQFLEEQNSNVEVDSNKADYEKSASKPQKTQSTRRTVSTSPIRTDTKDNSTQTDTVSLSNKAEPSTVEIAITETTIVLLDSETTKYSSELKESQHDSETKLQLKQQQQQLTEAFHTNANNNWDVLASDQQQPEIQQVIEQQQQNSQQQQQLQQKESCFEKRSSVAPSDSVSCGCARFLNNHKNSHNNKNNVVVVEIDGDCDYGIYRRRNSESDSPTAVSVAAAKEKSRLSSLRGVKVKSGLEKRASKASSSFFPRVRAAAAKAPLNAASALSSDDEALESHHADLYVRRHTVPNMTVAAYGMVICGTDNIHRRYRGRIEKVKFGIPISEAFVHDIPATLLVLLLKVNKEGPLKKDIWRAPGNQIQVRKLSAIMQQGRLVNISNISVYTAASVLKKFLSKLPGGIFGADNEKQLFNIVQQQQQISEEEQRKIFCRVICSLSQPSQHLLVLLFGTFRVIADSADTFGTRMNADAIGISVAPSLFHTCIHDQRAKLEDVMRFKMASQMITKIIHGFGYTNLFPRECYEFYARITGRTLRVDDQWNFTFQYPSRTCSQPSIPAASTSRGVGPSSRSASAGARACRRGSHATAASADNYVGESDEGDEEEEELGDILEDEDVYGESLPELGHHGHYVMSSYGEVAHAYRARMHSLDDAPSTSAELAPGMFERRGERLSTSMGAVSDVDDTMLPSTSAGLRRMARGLVGRETSGGLAAGESLARRVRRRCPADALESTRSLTYLEYVHEEQTKRMISRSEWFLNSGDNNRRDGGSKPQSASSSRWDVVTPAKDESVSCRSTDYSAGHIPSPMHLTLPKQDEDLLTSSGDEDLSGVFLTSSSSSMKCSPRLSSNGTGQQPSTSRAGTANSKMSVDPQTAITSDDDDVVPPLVDETKDQEDDKLTARQPLKLLQSAAESTPPAGGPRRRFFASGGGSSTETTPAATTSKSPIVFQYGQSSGVDELNVDELRGSTSSTSGSGVSVATAVQASQQQQQQQLLQRCVSSSGSVVRRRSWRTHYTRPNKSLEYDSGQTKVELSETSHSSPIAYSARSVNAAASRQVSDDQSPNANNENEPKAGGLPAAGSARHTIFRQTSASGTTTGGDKKKIQSRRSTNI